jgi:hypothetical protein
MRSVVPFRRVLAVLLVLALGTLHGVSGAGRPQAQSAAGQAPRFGGAYSGLDPRRQQLVKDWVARFSEVIGRQLEPGPFYDEQITLSQKTTFDAITYALMTTPLTDESGTKFGDGLSIIDRVDSVRGQVLGAAGDRQFRMYVRLKPDAVKMLERSKEFQRRMDNTIYHKGYPTNYREQGGTPSIQVSTAPDGARADIDVDYRSASFPAAMFNGHLTASNSDVRAGNNYERHVNRWAGFQNWWGSFFGIRTTDNSDETPEERSNRVSYTPRAGKASIDAMMNDFMKAWLIEGDTLAAMSYISERAYACMAQDLDDPTTFDRGMAPFRLMRRLKVTHDALGSQTSLEGLAIGVRLAFSALKVVQQPHHAQFVIYSVPDDIAARFDCESRLMIGTPKRSAREYGNYYGAAFYVNAPNGGKNQSMALLWAKDGGYWKIVSWQAEPINEPGAEPEAAPASAPASTVASMKADPTFVAATKDFLDSWLIKKDYDAAFAYLSPRSYSCYDLTRSPDAPASTSPDDAGRKIRAALERSGGTVGKATSLGALIAPVHPVHTAIHEMDHTYASAFTLASVPNVLIDAADCAAPARGQRFEAVLTGEYGKAFGLSFRFQTGSGDAPVLRMLWAKENDAWRITAYDVEQP